MNAYYHCLQSIHYYAILDTLELSFHIHHKVDLHVGGEKYLETVQTFAGLSSSVVVNSMVFTNLLDKYLIWISRLNCLHIWFPLSTYFES